MQQPASEACVSRACGHEAGCTRARMHARVRRQRRRQSWSLTGGLLPADQQVTMDYDMAAPLAAPRWLDGFMRFGGVLYEPGLCVIIDVR